MNKNIIRALCFSVVLPFGIPSVQAATVIGHDDVVPLTSSAGNIHTKFSPRLRIEHGCDYQAAIDASARVSGGLKDSGSHNGNCSSMPGQIYARTAYTSDGFIAVMYAYYFAKDNGFPFPSIGHRHDWEHIVVWTKDGAVVGASYSAHGDYRKTTSPSMVDSTHVTADYELDGFTHAILPSNATSNLSVEGLISYARLSSEIRTLLDSYSWGSAVFPMKSSNFYQNIEESRPSGL